LFKGETNISLKKKKEEEEEEKTAQFPIQLRKILIKNLSRGPLLWDASVLSPMQNQYTSCFAHVYSWETSQYRTLKGPISGTFSFSMVGSI
jgi:hypothetical protein